MILNVYAIFDIKAKCFANPFYMAHNGQALRAFSDLVQDEKTNVNKHPEDFKLYKLASYDDVEGKFKSLDVPDFLANASDYIAEKIN